MGPIQSRTLTLLLALSRVPHLLLDLATPMVAALLCLGALPGPKVIILGLVTVFAGYASIYALNDVVDYNLDRRRMAGIARNDSCFDLDCLLVRHPLAQGLLPLGTGIGWTVFWAAVALAGAAALNPLCALIFVVAALLETVYCKLYHHTQWKILLAAVVKTLGGIAAIYAVNPQPPARFVLFFFLWIACWEVGGQNIPNDLMDLEEDGKLGGKTVPVIYGRQIAVLAVIISLLAAFIFGMLVVFLSPLTPKLLYLFGAAVSGLLFILMPLQHFLRQPDTGATVLFNRASIYPVGVLFTTAVCVLI